MALDREFSKVKLAIVKIGPGNLIVAWAVMIRTRRQGRKQKGRVRGNELELASVTV